MSYQTFLERLNPKVAKALKTAASTEVVKIPLASIALTEELNGGLAKGRISLIFGPPSSGKSLLLLQSIAKWQKQGLVCAWADVEGAFDKDWAKRLGVNVDELVLIGSKSSGRLENEIRPLLEAEIDVIVIDSISDILPEVFIGEKGEMNEQDKRKQMGSQAKAITMLLNGIHYVNKDTAVILISQTTTDLSMTYPQQIPHGGQKTLFASSTIIKLNSSASPNEQIEEEVMVDGHLFKRPVARSVDWLIRKNKLASPFGTGTYRMYYAGPKAGIDNNLELLDEAIKFGVVIQGGAWFNYGEKKWQGRNNLLSAMENDKDLFNEVLADLKVARNGGEVA